MKKYLSYAKSLSNSDRQETLNILSIIIPNLSSAIELLLIYQTTLVLPVSKDVTGSVLKSSVGSSCYIKLVMLLNTIQGTFIICDFL